MVLEVRDLGYFFELVDLFNEFEVGLGFSELVIAPFEFVHTVVVQVTGIFLILQGGILGKRYCGFCCGLAYEIGRLGNAAPEIRRRLVKHSHNSFQVQLISRVLTVQVIPENLVAVRV